MTSQSALERRIKRHVTGRTHAFYAVAAPGLEALCHAEIAGRLPSAEIESDSEGGVAFNTRLHHAYAVNLWSATASRVLMRIGEFNADGFGKLKRKTRRFPWELYIPGGASLHVNVALHRSRLYHRDAVAERIREGIEDRFAGQGLPLPVNLKAEHTTTLYARAVNDRFTLSLDMSGEHLHKRGVKIRGGDAPLRETLAAAVLRMADYGPVVPLIDPMCGSGTFSLEAAMMAKQIPPGWFRRFAFEDWPGFQAGRWRHLRREAQKGMQSAAEPLIFASDRKSAMVGALKETLRNSGMDDAVRVIRKDFFDLVPARFLNRKGLLILNPPYGRRLDTPQESLRLYREIGRKIRRDFKGWRSAVLSPSDELEARTRIRGKRFPLFHGGLNLTLTLSDIR